MDEIIFIMAAVIVFLLIFAHKKRKERAELE